MESRGLLQASSERSPSGQPSVTMTSSLTLPFAAHHKLSLSRHHAMAWSKSGSDVWTKMIWLDWLAIWNVLVDDCVL